VSFRPFSVSPTVSQRSYPAIIPRRLEGVTVRFPIVHASPNPLRPAQATLSGDAWLASSDPLPTRSPCCYTPRSDPRPEHRDLGQ
jgi:hypothetical protein